jgi:hypothetical protein
MLQSGGMAENYMNAILGGQVTWRAHLRTTPPHLMVNIVGKMLIVSEIWTFRAASVD